MFLFKFVLEFYSLIDFETILSSSAYGVLGPTPEGGCEN